MTYSYGGQALIEGVMMRGKKTQSMVVRLESGIIEHQTESFSSWGDRLGFLKWPFVRGCTGLFESLVVGMKAITWSTNMSLAEDEDEEELTTLEMGITILIAFVLGMGLFFFLPVVLSNFMRGFVPGTLAQNLIEGIIRVIIFIVYLYLITRMKEIYRVFQYHGAEHKTIHCYESGGVLTPENAMQYSRLHPRCGTSFLFLVMIISILIFSLVGVDNLLLRLLSRILLLPVVAGVSYEILRYTGSHMDHGFVRLLAWPGMQLQHLTTAEPTRDMLEVAIYALQEVRQVEEGIIVHEPSQEIEDTIRDSDRKIDSTVATKAL